MTKPFRPPPSAVLGVRCSENDFHRLLQPVGPFDGGCLAVACALRLAFGGYLWALWSDRNGDQPEHVVCGDGMCFADAGGVFAASRLLKLWEPQIGKAGRVWIESVDWETCVAHDCGLWESFKHGSGPKTVTDLAELLVDLRQS